MTGQRPGGKRTVGVESQRHGVAESRSKRTEHLQLTVEGTITADFDLDRPDAAIDQGASLDRGDLGVLGQDQAGDRDGLGLGPIQQLVDRLATPLAGQVEQGRFERKGGGGRHRFEATQNGRDGFGRLLAQAQASMDEELADQPAARARFMVTIARIAMNRMDLDGAATLYEQSLALQEQHSAPNDPALARTVGSLGVLYRRQGRLDEAEAMAVRAVALNEAAPERNPGNLSATISWLANLYNSQQRYEEAIAGHRRALEIRRNEEADNIGAIAESLNNLGVALRQNGQFTEARPILLEAESLFTQAFGPQHPWVVGCWLNLAGIEEKLGQWQKAESLLMRASAAFLEMHGPNHARTLLARRALGALWSRWYRLDEALAHFESMLAGLEGQPEVNRLPIARVRTEIGLIHRKAGDLDRADTYLRRVLDTYVEQYGAEHAFTNRIRGFLALVTWDRGNVAEAAASFEHLAAESLRQRGDRHPITAVMFLQLGRLRTELGQLAKAEVALEQAHTISDALYDAPTVEAAGVLLALGKLRRLQGRAAEGAERVAQSLEIFESLLPPDHPDLAEARAAASAS